MIKYLGQLLCSLRSPTTLSYGWLYIRKNDAKEGKGHDISLEDVTLTIITVRRPREVLKELRHVRFAYQRLRLMVLGNQLNVRYSGHYQWYVMGVKVHLVVINQLPVTREHYAWLSFAEGIKYQQYQENLAQDIQQNEEFQVYLELLQELEEEGKERMADEVLKRIIMKMPPEKRLAIWNTFADDLPEVLKSVSAEKRREVLKEFSVTELREILRELSSEDS